MALIQINKNPSLRQLRLFSGVWFPLFFTLIGVQIWHKTGSLEKAIPIVVVTAAIALLGLTVPAVARLLYVGLSYVTFPIGFVLSHVILGAVFYLVVTPLGLLMRLVGYDPMSRRIDRSARTYWIRCNPPTTSERYFRQY